MQIVLNFISSLNFKAPNCDIFSSPNDNPLNTLYCSRNFLRADPQNLEIDGMDALNNFQNFKYNNKARQDISRMLVFPPIKLIQLAIRAINKMENFDYVLFIVPDYLLPDIAQMLNSKKFFLQVQRLCSKRTLNIFRGKQQVGFSMLLIFPNF